MSERRRRTLVNKFQNKLIVRMLCYAAIYQFTLWNFLFLWRLLMSGAGDFAHQYGQFSRDFAPMLLCVLALIPSLIWDALKFSHRIAGPIVQISRAVRDVADRRPLGYVRLRENDELKELQDDFNDMLDSLSASGAVTLISDVQARGTDEPNACGDDSPDMVEEEVSYVSN